MKIYKSAAKAHKAARKEGRVLAVIELSVNDEPIINSWKRVFYYAEFYLAGDGRVGRRGWNRVVQIHVGENS